MHAVILAAGEGSRMGPRTDGVPKAFMDLGGRTLFERQRSILADYVDEVTVVLGYAAENVRDDLGSAHAVVIPDWDQYDNAESLRRALGEIDDDVLVLNGDVVVAQSVLERLLDRFESFTRRRNAVACIPGHQEGSTAIRCDDRDIVTDYGMIRGHRHAGLGIVHHGHVEAARTYLADHRQEWYPVVYPAFETEMVPIEAGNHVEINRPRDVVAAHQKFDRMAPDEADA